MKLGAGYGLIWLDDLEILQLFHIWDQLSASLVFEWVTVFYKARKTVYIPNECNIA